MRAGPGTATADATASVAIEREVSDLAASPSWEVVASPVTATTRDPDPDPGTRGASIGPVQAASGFDAMARRAVPVSKARLIRRHGRLH